MECATFTQWFVNIAWLEVFKVVKDLIVGVGWPAAIFLLGYTFRDELRNKLGYLQAAGPSGVTFHRQEFRKSLDLETLLLDVGNHRPAVRAVEDPILRDLEKVKDEQHIPVLVNQLAIARLGRHFEEIYSIIFQGQIEGLQRLEASGGNASVADAEQFYEQLKAREPEFYGDNTFTDWFRYIKTSGLADHSSDTTIHITEMGSEFLLFVSATKVGRARPH